MGVLPEGTAGPRAGRPRRAGGGEPTGSRAGGGQRQSAPSGRSRSTGGRPPRSTERCRTGGLPSGPRGNALLGRELRFAGAYGARLVVTRGTPPQRRVAGQRAGA